MNYFFQKLSHLFLKLFDKAFQPDCRNLAHDKEILAYQKLSLSLDVLVQELFCLILMIQLEEIQPFCKVLGIDKFHLDFLLSLLYLDVEDLKFFYQYLKLF